MEPRVLCLVQRAIDAQGHRLKLGDQQFNDLFLLVQPRLRTVECIGQKAVDLVLIHVMILKYFPRTRHLLRVQSIGFVFATPMFGASCIYGSSAEDELNVVKLYI